MRSRKFICEDCGKSPNAPMLKHEVWEAIADKRTILCIRCTEQRLNRQIVMGDLLPCLGNDWGLALAKRFCPSLDLGGYEAHHRVERAVS